MGATLVIALIGIAVVVPVIATQPTKTRFLIALGALSGVSVALAAVFLPQLFGAACPGASCDGGMFFFFTMIPVGIVAIVTALIKAALLWSPEKEEWEKSDS